MNSLNAMNDTLHALWADSSHRAAQRNRAAARKPAPPVKQIVTIRLDQDVLEFFKLQGPGYQTRINQVLREQMAAQRQQDDE